MYDMGGSRCARSVAAMVCPAHTAHQPEARSTLAGLPALPQDSGLCSPAMLVTGEVAAMRAAIVAVERAGPDHPRLAG